MKSTVLSLLAVVALGYTQTFDITNSNDDVVVQVDTNNYLNVWNGVSLENLIDTIRTLEQDLGSAMARITSLEECACVPQCTSPNPAPVYDSHMYWTYQSVSNPMFFVNSDMMAWTYNGVSSVGGFIAPILSDWDKSATKWGGKYINNLQYVTRRGRVVFTNTWSHATEASLVIGDVIDIPGSEDIINMVSVTLDDGWSGSIKRVSNSDTEFLFQTDATTIRVYDVPTTGNTLEFNRVINLTVANVLPYATQGRCSQFSYDGCTIRIPNDSAHACADTSAYQDFDEFGNFVTDGTSENLNSVYSLSYHWGRNWESSTIFCPGLDSYKDNVPSNTITYTSGGPAGDSTWLDFNGNPPSEVTTRA